MDEQDVQQVIERVADAAEKAAQSIARLLAEAEDMLTPVQWRLIDWATNLREQTGGSDDKSPQYKYDYVIAHSNEVDKALWDKPYVKEFLLSEPDVLEALYQERLVEHEPKARFDFEDIWKIFNPSDLD